MCNPLDTVPDSKTLSPSDRKTLTLSSEVGEGERDQTLEACRELLRDARPPNCISFPATDEWDRRRGNLVEQIGRCLGSRA